MSSSRLASRVKSAFTATYKEQSRASANVVKRGTFSKLWHEFQERFRVGYGAPSYVPLPAAKRDDGKYVYRYPSPASQPKAKIPVQHRERDYDVSLENRAKVEPTLFEREYKDPEHLVAMDISIHNPIPAWCRDLDQYNEVVAKCEETGLPWIGKHPGEFGWVQNLRPGIESLSYYPKPEKGNPVAPPHQQIPPTP